MQVSANSSVSSTAPNTISSPGHGRFCSVWKKKKDPNVGWYKCLFTKGQKILSWLLAPTIKSCDAKSWKGLDSKCNHVRDVH